MSTAHTKADLGSSGNQTVPAPIAERVRRTRAQFAVNDEGDVLDGPKPRLLYRVGDVGGTLTLSQLCAQYPQTETWAHAAKAGEDYPGKVTHSSGRACWIRAYDGDARPDCERCDGTGRLDNGHDWMDCPNCEGNGATDDRGYPVACEVGVSR